ncbi:MAG: murein hydrolase activator EnvC family protein [Rhizobiaceae bacterium]
MPRLTPLILAAILALPPATLAQDIVQQRDDKKVELEQVRDRLQELQQRRESLKEEIAALDKDAAAINRALIEAAKRGQQLEGEIAKSEHRLAKLDRTRGKIRASLAERRAVLAEIIGAMQRMGRKPPPALLVRPEDALSSVRSAIMLGAVVPEIRTETDALLSDLDVLSQTTQRIEEEKTALRERLNALAEDETRLTLLIEEKNNLAKKSQEVLEEERRRSAKLAEDATSLESLIGGLETEIASAAEAAKAAREADAKRRKEAEERLAKARASLGSGPDSIEQRARIDPKTADNSRLAPAIAFSRARGALPKPVQGIVLHGFGQKTASSPRSPNIAFATRPNSRVRSPTDGWVVYAGPFRSYGQLLILNAGDGYHVVLSGMSKVDATQGRFVLAGEPVGQMGVKRVAAAGSVKLGSTRPVLYVEFRKDGNPVDPAPWWARGTEGPDNDS